MAATSRRQVRWDDFTHAGKLALAKQTVAILEAIATACADKDYRAAFKAVTAVSVGFKADGGALQMAHNGASVSVVFSETSYNPREVASAWITSKF